MNSISFNAAPNQIIDTIFYTISSISNKPVIFNLIKLNAPKQYSIAFIFKIIIVISRNRKVNIIYEAVVNLNKMIKYDCDMYRFSVY